MNLGENEFLNGTNLFAKESKRNMWVDSSQLYLNKFKLLVSKHPIR